MYDFEDEDYLDMLETDEIVKVNAGLEVQLAETKQKLDHLYYEVWHCMLIEAEAEGHYAVAQQFAVMA